MLIGIQSEELLKKMRLEKGHVCVSIIIPYDYLYLNRRVVENRVQRIVENAKGQLNANVDPDLQNVLSSKIDDMQSQLDFASTQKGIGIYVSENIQEVLTFPFTVPEKIFIGENFLLRYLLLKQAYSKPCYLLHITKGQAKLFRSDSDKLEEVIDQNFPFLYEDDFRYSPTLNNVSQTGYTQVNGFINYESINTETRYKTFLKDLDGTLDAYLKTDGLLIVCGVRKEESYFINLSTHIEQLIGVLMGNYENKSLKELTELIFPIIASNINQKNGDEVIQFEEMIGEGLGESGILDVWRAVKEGRGVKLLVEKDYYVRGYLGRDDYRLFLSMPESINSILPDAIESLIHLALEMNEKVVVLENGLLKNYDHVGLITRY